MGIVTAVLFLKKLEGTLVDSLNNFLEK